MTWLRRSPAERGARAQLRAATQRFKAAETQQQADQAGAEMDHAEDLLRQAQGKPPLERPAGTDPGTAPAPAAEDEPAQARRDEGDAGQAFGLQLAEELAQLGEPRQGRTSWRHAELAARIRDAGHEAGLLIQQSGEPGYKPASGYRLVHDPADPRCMTEMARGEEHGIGQPDNGTPVHLTPEQEAAADRAYDLYEEIEDNYRAGAPARNEMEQRLYGEFQLTDDTTLPPMWADGPERGWDPEPEDEAGQ